MKTVLIVDDSKTARLTLKRKLDLIQGVQVDMADSGETAVELLSHSAPPDLIFMDVFMGNMSGYEAAATILQNPVMADVPIVMCTSKDTQEDRDEAAHSGAKGFIVKPITDEALDKVWHDFVLNRVPSSPAIAQAEPVVMPTAVTEIAQATPQFVITNELEALVRQMVEQASLQRAKEAAAQVVHAALGEHLHQVEDILEGKINILTSSLAALHSAQEQAQAEFKNVLASIPQANKPVDDSHIAALVTQQITDFEAQEHSKRALHEIDLQAKLEQSLPKLAAQSAQNVAERMVNQALGSHFAMMEDRLNAISVELGALKSNPVVESKAAVFDEQAMLATLDAQLGRRMNETLPAMLAAQAKTHLHASDEKLQSIQQELSARIQTLSDALPAPNASPAPSALPEEFPKPWMQQLLAKQDERLVERLNAWNAQMDTHIAQQEQAMFERIEKKMNALALQNLAAENTTVAQKPNAFTSKLALGLAVLGVVLALIALFN